MSMISKEALRDIVYSQKETLQKLQNSLERDILPEILKWKNDSRIIILTGIRRSGKSTLLLQLMKYFKSYSYMNFEDERLLGFEAKEFEKLNEILIEVYKSEDTYFFDEIQNIDQFEVFLRRLQDSGKKIFITGSNASLLSREFGTRLTGRYKSFEIFPFSFLEFARFKGQTITKNPHYSSFEKSKGLNLLKEYSEIGGFPEYIENNDFDYISMLFQNIIYRDIIVRYSIKREKSLKELASILSTNVALPFTYNSLKSTLGFGNSISVKEYISYLSNSYLFFEVLKISSSLKKQLASPRKIYSIDPAIARASGVIFSPNKGRVLENLVFLELKRKGNEIYYYSEASECDFVIKKQNKIDKVIQVCFSLNSQNKEREVAGLMQAINTYNLKEGIILTFEQLEELKVDGKKIRVLPFLNWVLENN